MPDIGESWGGGEKGGKVGHVYGYPEHEGGEGVGGGG